MAPEIVARSGEGHWEAADVWSFGVLAYTLMVGVPPFQMVDLETTYARIKAGEFSFARKRDISEAARHLIQCTLNLDPAKRPLAS
jgi:polo-like kinase 1